MPRCPEAGCYRETSDRHYHCGTCGVASGMLGCWKDGGRPPACLERARRLEVELCRSTLGTCTCGAHVAELME